MNDGRSDRGDVASEALIRRLANELYRNRPPTPSSPPTEGIAPSNAPANAVAAPFGGRAASALPRTGRPATSMPQPDYYFLRHAAPGRRPPERGIGLGDARNDFPALHQRVHGRRLVWLDNAATTQKPRAVIEALSRFYECDNSNVHRGAHALAARATDAFEQAREKVRLLLGAFSREEIVFVRGTTEAINLVAQAYGRANVGPGDEILVTTLEHHSNIVPWQMLAREKNAMLRVVPIDDRGDVILDEYERMLGPRVKIVALAHVSNALGTVLPVQEMTLLAHRHGAKVVVDGAQAVSHLPVDVASIGSDFYAFSGHKLFGPTGVGVLYGRRDLLEAMPPWQGGGSMIRTVTFESTTYNDPPYKFEAGTPVIGDAVGLGAAIDYVLRIGLPAIAAYEHALLAYATDALSRIPGLRLIGTSPNRAAVVSLVVDWMRSEDLGRFLDQEGVAVRAGHHCAQPALARFGLTSTVRPSLALYNTYDDLDLLVAALKKAHAAARA
ncbi:MAG: SufS family cysteine desulfurase [Actinomycetota bacterium]